MTNRKKQLFLKILMAATIMTTTSPLVLLANRITPFVLGMPFFLFWCSAMPFILFGLMHGYDRIAAERRKDRRA